MTPKLQELITQAQRRPMGDSWTYATTKEFGDALTRAVIDKCAEFVYNSEDLTLGQSYTVRKKMLKHLGVEE